MQIILKKVFHILYQWPLQSYEGSNSDINKITKINKKLYNTNRIEFTFMFNNKNTTFKSMSALRGNETKMSQRIRESNKDQDYTKILDETRINYNLRSIVISYEEKW